MTVTSFLVALAVLGLTPQAGSAQTPPPSSQADQVEDVVVIGRDLQDAVDSFVDEVIAPPPGRGPARWDRKVCVGVANLRRDVAQPLIDRVSEVALDIGLEIGEPGCVANILILATDDGTALATALVDARPRAFRPGYSGAARSREALERFTATDRPVRWWHVSVPVDADTGQIAVRIPGFDPPMINTLASRLRTEVQNDLRRALIIVDFSRADRVSFQQLADYVAMVAFAQVDPDAELAGFDTVLNVFADPAGTAGLTDWDRAYLTSLYDAELNQRVPSQQGGEVGRIMVRDLQRPGPEAPPPADAPATPAPR